MDDQISPDSAATFMRAVRITGHDGRGPELAQLPRPEPGPGQVLVRIRAAALNFADLLMAQGSYQETPPLPFTAGIEGAGEIVALGRDVEELAPGQRVAMNARGVLADYAVIDAGDCVVVPDNLDWDAAAALLVAHGTSALALARCTRTGAAGGSTAGLGPGQRLVVLGAAGGAGLSAVEIGAARGAEVVAVARGADRLEIARRAGASTLIDTTVTPDLRAALRELGGVDVVYDAVGAEAGEAAFGALRRGGHFLVIGFAGGRPPVLPLNHALVKNLTIHGFYWGGLRHLDPAGFAAGMSDLMAMASARQVRPHIGLRLPLDRISEAYTALENRALAGKLVITL